MLFAVRGVSRLVRRRAFLLLQREQSLAAACKRSTRFKPTEPQTLVRTHFRCKIARPGNMNALTHSLIISLVVRVGPPTHGRRHARTKPHTSPVNELALCTYLGCLHRWRRAVLLGASTANATLLSPASAHLCKVLTSPAGRRLLRHELLGLVSCHQERKCGVKLTGVSKATEREGELRRGKDGGRNKQECKHMTAGFADIRA